MGVQAHEYASVCNSGIHDGRSCRHKLEHIKSAFVTQVADESGQSTVEYAVVLSGFLLVVVALALFVSAARDGSFMGLASEACAYVTNGSFVSVLRDVPLF